MLKAVVFDDENIVLMGLRAVIDWGSYGIELVGTADNGIEALQMFRDLRPDIVLTDIRMPGMDGLDLIETISMEAQDTMFVVFSGFNEFEYVRRAIGLGVVDYLEKPITVDKIKNAIEKTIKRIVHQYEISAMKTKLEKNQLDLLEKATLELLLTGEQALDKWTRLYGESDWINGVTVLAFNEEKVELPNNLMSDFIHVGNGPERLAVMVHHELPQEPLLETSMEWSNETAVLFGSGRTYSSMADAPKSYREALRALRYGRFMKETGWIRIQDIEGSSDFPIDLSKHEEGVILSLRTLDKESLDKALESFQVWMETQKLDPEKAEHEILKLVYRGLEVVKDVDRDIQLPGIIPHQELSSMQTREEMMVWLNTRLVLLMDWLKANRTSNKNIAVEKALAYLEANYGNDVYLQELAEHVGLNPTYFSLLFREQMGITYIKYLTNLRIEHAKMMLKEGLRVNEVSGKVGYLNHRHFNEIFKKQVGMTPGQYKENHSSR
ncbi:response regulator [Paenibacillus sp. LHD-117]|uniref:response regulator n=1 Tax=Paenibacillus sp. LHD-117 TaxID=3071412 RepID=UPI0027E0CDC2|nr:response regulator [Paenibacillus sp. LHD-117]MDQ6417941.1 response regulator [Paenibacillus sp. LHD-117]